MKTSRRAAFTDPFFAQLCGVAEQLILSADETATANGIKLTDSGVKSALIKAANLLRGRQPKNIGSNPKELFLANLTYHVAGMWRQPGSSPAGAEDATSTTSVTASQWLTVLDGIIQSIETRMTGEPGGRDYLAFLPEFPASMPRIVSFPGAPARTEADAV